MKFLFFVLIFIATTYHHVMGKNYVNNYNANEGRESEGNYKIILHWGKEKPKQAAEPVKEDQKPKNDNHTNNEPVTSETAILADPQVIEYNEVSGEPVKPLSAINNSSTSPLIKTAPPANLSQTRVIDKFNPGSPPLPVAKQHIPSATAAIYSNTASNPSYNYTICRGDTPESVAKKFNTSTFEIRSLFNDSNQNAFVSGKNYNIPLDPSNGTTEYINNNRTLNIESLENSKKVNYPSSLSNNSNQASSLPKIDRNRLIELKVLPLPTKAPKIYDTINTFSATSASIATTSLSSPSNPTTPKPPTGNLNFVPPCKGKIISSTFKPGSESPNGILIEATNNSKIVAIEDGIIALVNNSLENYATLVAINHGYGYLSVYGLTSDVIVEKGDSVKKGDIIGKVRHKNNKNKTANLFFSLRYHKKPLNPEEYFNYNNS